MVKLDQKLIFWSLAVHRYPKKPPGVIIFAAMEPGMKMVFDENFLAKKNENLNFFCKTYVINIKRKLGHVEFIFTKKKYDLYSKK